MKGRTRSGKPRRRSGGGERFTVRQATAEDVDVLVRQRRLMWENMGVRDKRVLDEADLVFGKWAVRELRKGTLKAWLAVGRGGKVVGGGCLWLQPVQPQPGVSKRVQPYLMSMFTEPWFRGKGVASRIVKAAADWGKKNGFSWIVLHPSKMGRQLYKRLGFKRAWEMELAFAGKKGMVRHGVRVLTEL